MNPDRNLKSKYCVKNFKRSGIHSNVILSNRKFHTG